MYAAKDQADRRAEQPTRGCPGPEHFVMKCCSCILRYNCLDKYIYIYKADLAIVVFLPPSLLGPVILVVEPSKPASPIPLLRHIDRPGSAPEQTQFTEEVIAISLTSGNIVSQDTLGVLGTF